jgi:hypothetical protein
MFLTVKHLTVVVFFLICKKILNCLESPEDRRFWRAWKACPIRTTRVLGKASRLGKLEQSEGFERKAWMAWKLGGVGRLGNLDKSEGLETWTSRKAWKLGQAGRLGNLDKPEGLETWTSQKAWKI